MAKIEIIVNGTSYPCRQTLGAMLRFKRETGKEVTEIGGNVSDLTTYLWCCVASACKADGIEFGLDLMDFADALAPEDIEVWTESMKAGQDGEEEEKKRQ